MFVEQDDLPMIWQVNLSLSVRAEKPSGIKTNFKAMINSCLISLSLLIIAFEYLGRLKKTIVGPKIICYSVISLKK